jgi:hypothetical protein
MKAYCPQCGVWTDDDWTDGPFGVCCWTCRYTYLALGRELLKDPGLMEAVGRMLARAYGSGNGASRAASAPGATGLH